MQHMNEGGRPPIDRIDLNLLVVFEAILRERSVTRAGQRLGLSQPAMSHALNRLRHMTGDRLFVRTPDGMEPTVRAERLALPVRRALLDLRSALEDEPFEPGYTRQRFAIAVNNYAAIALAGAIVLRARALAPGVQIRLRPSGTLDVADLLDRGELDLALVSGAPPLARYGSALLIEDDFVAVVRQGHPLLGAPLDSAGFAAQAHLTISSSGDDLTGLDEALARQGLARNSEIEVPYLSAGAVLTQSDMMAIMARQIAVAFARVHPVALVELPLQPAPLRQMLVWQRRFEDQAAQRWLRETIASVAADLRSAR